MVSNSNVLPLLEIRPSAGMLAKVNTRHAKYAYSHTECITWAAYNLVLAKLDRPLDHRLRRTVASPLFTLLLRVELRVADNGHYRKAAC